jgi:hypothetical protein
LLKISNLVFAVQISAPEIDDDFEDDGEGITFTGSSSIHFPQLCSCLFSALSKVAARANFALPPDDLEEMCSEILTVQAQTVQETHKGAALDKVLASDAKTHNLVPALRQPLVDADYFAELKHTDA